MIGNAGRKAKRREEGEGEGGPEQGGTKTMGRAWKES